MPAVVITGVSTGIGAGAARAFTGAGFEVFGSVRKIADGERLADEIGPRFHALMFDVTNEGQVLAGAAEVRQALAGERLAALINNAGIALSAPLELQPTDEFRQQIEVNLIGPFVVAKAFIPLLGADKSMHGPPGKIINISSVGGRVGPPFLGAYAAAKHGLEGYSESLRRELRIHGVDVVIVGPGSVATPIWDKAPTEASNLHAGSVYGPAMAVFGGRMIEGGRKGFTPDYLGQKLLEIVQNPRPRTRYALVPGRFVNWTLPTTLPKRVIDRIIGKAIGLIKT